MTQFIDQNKIDDWSSRIDKANDLYSIEKVREDIIGEIDSLVADESDKNEAKNIVSVACEIEKVHIFHGGKK